LKRFKSRSNEFRQFQALFHQLLKQGSQPIAQIVVAPRFSLRASRYENRARIRRSRNQGSSSVTFREPDFVDADGIEYTDIEVIVEMDGDIRDTVQLVKTLERPLTERK
jgi:hypothetical protein